MSHDDPASRLEPSHEPSTGWTGPVAVTYGAAFTIVVAILYAVAAYAIPT